MCKWIMMVAILSLALVACSHQDKKPPSDGAISICDILKQDISTQTYKDTNEMTLKRKTAVDQARLLKEYEQFNCPEITGPLGY